MFAAVFMVRLTIQCLTSCGNMVICLGFFSLSVGEVFTLSFWMQIMISFVYQIIWKLVLSVSVIRIVDFIPNIFYIGSKMLQPSGLHIYLFIFVCTSEDQRLSVDVLLTWRKNLETLITEGTKCPISLMNEQKNGTYHSAKWMKKSAITFASWTNEQIKNNFEKIYHNICFQGQ